MIDNLFRDKLLFRAGYKCEYCHRGLLDAPWQIEHILPKNDYGGDDFQNLAVSCPRCNLNKHKATESVDFVTGKKSRLFNPRKDKWKNNFGIVAGQLVGRTSIGRATARLLFKRTEQHLPPDLSWWPITSLKDETLYRFLNHQRARRLGNKFDDLERAFAEIPFLKTVSGRDHEEAKFASLLLLGEVLYTRSTRDDVKNAFKIVAAASQLKGIDSRRQEELLNVTSIILQQLATVFVLEEKYAEARVAQTEAFLVYKKRLDLTGGGDNREKLRLIGLQNKYLGNDANLLTRDVVRSAIEEAVNGNLGCLSYAADALVTCQPPNKEVESVLDTMNNLLLSIGYGQDFDYGFNVVVRRRWWILQAYLNSEIDLDLFLSDLQYWKSINMENEIRELAVALQKLKNRDAGKGVKDMLVDRLVS